MDPIRAPLLSRSSSLSVLYIKFLRLFSGLTAFQFQVPVNSWHFIRLTDHRRRFNTRPGAANLIYDQLGIGSEPDFLVGHVVPRLSNHSRVVMNRSERFSYVTVQFNALLSAFGMMHVFKTDAHKTLLSVHLWTGENAICSGIFTA